MFEIYFFDIKLGYDISRRFNESAFFFFYFSRYNFPDFELQTNYLKRVVIYEPFA